MDRTKFWHFLNDRWQLKFARKTGRKAFKEENKIADLKGRINTDFRMGEEDKLLKDVEQLIVDLRKEGENLEKIGEEDHKVLFDRFDDIKRIVDDVLAINPNKVNTQSLQTIKTAKEKLMQIKKAIIATSEGVRDDDFNLKDNRSLLYVQALGVEHGLQVIVRLEKHMRKEEKVIEKDEHAVEADLKEIRKGHSVDDAKLLTTIEELWDQSKKMCEEMKEAQHLVVASYFHVMKEVESLRSFLIHLRQTGFDPHKEEHLAKEYQELVNSVNSGIELLASMAEYSVERQHKG